MGQNAAGRISTRLAAGKRGRAVCFSAIIGCLVLLLLEIIPLTREALRPAVTVTKPRADLVEDNWEEAIAITKYGNGSCRTAFELQESAVQRPMSGETMASLASASKELKRRCSETKTLLVLLWIRGDRPEFFFTPDRFGFLDIMPRLCPLSCVRFVATQDRCLLAKADMVIFNFDFFDAWPMFVPPRPRSDIVYVYTSIENSNMKPRVADVSVFNLFWSYHRDLTMRTSWLTAVNASYPHFLRPPLVPFKERESVLLASLVTRCSDYIGRGKFLGELMQHMPVHNFGACHHNRGKKGSYAAVAERNGKPILSYYKFILTIENSLCTDHVSEKFDRALQLSAVPVVASKDNLPPYEKLSPSDPFYVNILEFRTVTAVAAKLRAVGGNEELYNSYMGYRYKRPEELKPGFRSMISGERGKNAALCKIAKLMKTAQDRQKLASIKLSINETCLQGDVIGKHFQLKK